MSNRKFWFASAACAAAAVPLPALAVVPVYDHVVVVVEENHSYQQITGTYASYAPYINNTLLAQGARFTNSFGEEHHSEGNYLWLLSGSNHSIGYSDPCPVGPFNSANLGASLIASGQSFKGYSEDLPSIGSTVCTSGAYARKHNPWVNFSNVPNGTTVASSSNLRFSDFPTGNYDQLPTVAFVVPNQDNDMHNGGDPASVANGDAWLHNRLDGYYQWARTHNSLLIVTFDEDQGSASGLTNPATGDNRVLTLIAGAGIAPGAYSQNLTHVNLLRTLEDMYTLPHAGSQQPLATAAGFSNASLAANFYVQWTGSGDGMWADESQWNQNVVPNGVGAVANLLPAGSASHLITLGAPVTVGVLNFDSPSAYQLQGAMLSLEAPSGASTSITVRSGEHRIDAPLTMLKDSRIRVDTASSLLVTDLQDTSYTITKTGGGTLAVNRLRAGALTISGGTISVIANGTSAAASRARSLQLAGGAAPTATLDLADNDLILTDTTPSSVQAQIYAARHGGAWDAAGITSSAARLQTAHATTLGLLRGDEYRAANGAMFDGFDVADRDVLVKYTWYGDTDFNGVVNFDDYVRTDNGFNNQLGGWLNGDFDGNGSVNFDDYVLIDLAFNAQDGTLRRALSFLDGSDRNADGMGAPALRKIQQHLASFGEDYAHAFLAAVPEPSAAILYLSAFAVAGCRRRRIYRKR